MKEKEFVKVGNETVKGFRKGMTKKKLIESMDETDWQRLEKFKKANDLAVENKLARDFYIQSDQLNVKREQLITETRNMVGGLLENYDAYLRFSSNIEANKTNEEGESVRVQKAATMKIKALMNKAIILIKANLSNLYIYTTYKMLDGETPVYELSAWEEEVQDIAKVIKEETSYNLF